jgi:hypothetical protein
MRRPWEVAANEEGGYLSVLVHGEEVGCYAIVEDARKERWGLAKTIRECVRAEAGQLANAEVQALITRNIRADERISDLERQLSEEREARGRLERDIAIVTTAIYYGDQHDHGHPEPRCPECREALMYMPNDCDTCERIGGHVTDESIEQHRAALKQGDTPDE